MPRPMRVIAGNAKGTPLHLPKNTSARPFLELARGAIMNILNARLTDAVVLDLYAGSGALGIEALSRGAKFACFVESDPATADSLEDNLQRCHLLNSAAIVRANVASISSWLSVLNRQQLSTDLVFIDPPFPLGQNWSENSIAKQLKETLASCVSKSSVLVFRQEDMQTKNADDFSDNSQLFAPTFSLWQTRVYGRSRISLYIVE